METHQRSPSVLLQSRKVRKKGNYHGNVIALSPAGVCARVCVSALRNRPGPWECVLTLGLSGAIEQAAVLEGRVLSVLDAVRSLRVFILLVGTFEQTQ